MSTTPLIEALESRWLLSAGASAATGIEASALHESAHIAPITSTGRVLHASAATPLSAVFAKFRAAKNVRNYQIDWGDGAPPETYFVGDGPLTVLFATHLFANPGSYQVVITDPQTKPVVDRVIVGPARPIVFSRKTIEATGLQVGDVAAGQVVSTDLAKLNGVPARFPSAIVKINWGDHAARQTASPADSRNSNGTITAIGNHTYQKAGIYLITTTFRIRGKGIVKIAKDWITITAAPPVSEGIDTLTAVTGTPFRGILGRLLLTSTPGEIDITWGDGTHSFAAMQPLGNNLVTITGAHTYANPATYAVSVVASSGRTSFPLPGQLLPAIATEFDGSFDSTITVTGNPVQLQAPVASVAGVAPITADADTVDAPVATLSGYPQDPTSPQVYATVDWGDGAGPSFGRLASVDFEDGHYVATGNHTFRFTNAQGQVTSGEGPHTATITFLLNDHNDNSQNTVLGQTHTIVNYLPNSPGGLTLNLTTNTPFSGTLGSFTPTRPFSEFDNASIDWGDGNLINSNATLTPNGDGTYNVKGSHAYAIADRYKITVTVNYGDPAITQYGILELASTAIVTS